VLDWRRRYEGEGIAGLADDARSGRPRTIDHREIVAVTLAPPPRKYGVTHWSSRLLGRHLGVSNGRQILDTGRGHCHCGSGSRERQSLKSLPWVGQTGRDDAQRRQRLSPPSLNTATAPA